MIKFQLIILATCLALICLLEWQIKKDDKRYREERCDAFSKEYERYRANRDKIDPYERRFGGYCDLNEQDYSL